MKPNDDFKQQQVGSAETGSVPPEELESHQFQPVGISTADGVKEFLLTNKWYVGAIILGLLIIGFLAFFALRPRPNAPITEANVDMSIDAPASAPAGSEVVYKVKMQNNDRASLQHLSLELIYPDGSSYVSSTPKANNLSGTGFDVPDLSSGQNAALIIKVKVNGNTNDDKKLTAVLHYNYSNFSSDFQKQITHSIRLVASDITMQISGPDQSTNAQQVSYTIEYSNNSDHDINNARIQVTYPEGFVFADGSPKPDLAKNIWNVGVLRQGANGKLTFQGTFKSAQPGQSQIFVADFQVRDAQGTFYSQSSANFTTAISALPLVVTQSLESGRNGQIVNPGDTLNYSVKYSNSATVSASGVNIVLTLDSPALDLSTLNAEGGDINNNTITWNASGVTNLEHLNPNDSGSLRFSVKVSNPAVRDSQKQITVKSTVKVKSNEYSTFLPGNDMALKVSSPAQIANSVTYVSGQLPLSVGKNTVFQVRLTLKNSTNDFSNSVVTGFIPSGTTYDPASVNAKEAQNVSFDSATGKLTWKVGILAAHSGDIDPPRIMTFNVRVNPASSQVNQDLTLLRAITFIGTDTFTNQSINLKSEDAKSSGIPNGSNDGRVQP